MPRDQVVRRLIEELAAELDALEAELAVVAGSDGPGAIQANVAAAVAALSALEQRLRAILALVPS